MIFHPQNLLKTEGSFILSKNVTASAHACLCKPIFKELWHNFTFQSSALSISESDELVFLIGSAEKLALDEYAYSINVTPKGICICGKDEKSLVQGFISLLDRFKAIDVGEETAVETECCQIKDMPLIQNRMIHFCIFAETKLYEIQRFIRLCGALKYTHIVLEFWGMLKYDCMKELSWSHGFAKEQIRPIVKEANDLGIEIVPMFNHWGHATAGRVMHGKHVVLDQNPALQTYFSEDGWCWDIRKPKVRALLRQIRNELIELCGEGKYFHIGCDEAYNFEFTEENTDALCGFINEISDEMTALGRRIFVWGDMMLYRYGYYNPKNRYTCNAPSPEIENYFLTHLKKDVIIADWQYHSTEAPIETCSVFQKAGFDCILCPWDEGRSQTDAALATVKDQSLMGYMHTTWHTLSSGMPYVTLMGVGGFEDIKTYKNASARPHTAALLRKVMPINGDYAKAGWAEFEIGFRW